MTAVVRKFVLLAKAAAFQNEFARMFTISKKIRSLLLRSEKEDETSRKGESRETKKI